MFWNALVVAGRYLIGPTMKLVQQFQGFIIILSIIKFS